MTVIIGSKRLTGASKERFWLLKRWWGRGGWSSMGGFQYGVKKWEWHKMWLSNQGYLEEDPDCPDCYRITDKGIAWLDEDSSD